MHWMHLIVIFKWMQTPKYFSGMWLKAALGLEFEAMLSLGRAA